MISLVKFPSGWRWESLHKLICYTWGISAWVLSIAEYANTVYSGENQSRLWDDAKLFMVFLFQHCSGIFAIVSHVKCLLQACLESKIHHNDYRMGYLMLDVISLRQSIYAHPVALPCGPLECVVTMLLRRLASWLCTGKRGERPVAKLEPDVLFSDDI